MPEPTSRKFSPVFKSILPFMLLAGLHRLTAQSAAGDGKSVGTMQHHGWNGSLTLSNGVVEVIVVPAVGRVMQFRFVGGDDVFWENPALLGKITDPSSGEWLNFGGDKAWPSPQSDWHTLTGKGWPPPATFDSTPLEARVEGGEIELVSPVDPHYGIRVRRRIALDPQRPVLTIKTTFEKVSGHPLKISIGVITQVGDFQRAYIALPAKSKFPHGYVHLNFEMPQDLKAQDGLLSVKRSRTAKTQIGSDGGTMLWMNEKCALRIESPLVPGAEYPNHGSSTVIYTNQDPDAYAELETFSPLRDLKAGDQIEQSNTYTLSKRTEKDPDAEARKALLIP